MMTGYINPPVLLLIYKPIQPLMKEKKLILIALAIPVLFYITIEMRGILEYYFRISEKYHYIYTYGSLYFLFVQVILLVVSFYIGLYMVVNRKQYSLKTKIIALLPGSSVFVAFAVLIVYIIVKVVSNS
jgi:hypothetical protein